MARYGIALGCLFGLLAGGAHAQPGPHVYPRVFVFSIGVERYKDRRITDARRAVADAEAFGESCRDWYGFTPISLVGERATRDAVFDRLDDFKTRLKPGSEPRPNAPGEPGDVLIIFFAGHGQVIERTDPDTGAPTRSGYLVPYDAELSIKPGDSPADVWARQAIDMDVLLAKVNQIPAQHVVLICDACCSGFMTKRGGLETRVDLQELLIGRSRQVLAATTDKDVALSGDKLGIFTEALLDEMKRAARNLEPISVTDAFVEVRKKVVAKSGRAMLPQLSRLAGGNGEFVFLPQNLPRQGVDTVMRDVWSNRQARGLSPDSRGVFQATLERFQLRAENQTHVRDVIAAYQADEYRYSINPVDQEKAWQARLERFKANAAIGDPLAMAGMHYCLSKGLGTAVDVDEGYRWARAAYDTGAPIGEHVLGRCYYNGIGVPKNQKAGRALMIQASRGGSPISHVSAGLFALEDGEWDRARTLLKEGSEAGVPEADFIRAEMQLGYVSGVGVMPGVEETAEQVQRAVKLLIPIAERGHARAQFTLAEVFAFHPHATNKAAAEKWLRRAADAGYGPAQAYLAQELARGWWIDQENIFLQLDLKQDYREAFRLAELAASQDMSVAHLLLAQMYEFGINRPEMRINPNYTKAREHVQRAAELNHPEAFTLQSQWYYAGRIYEKDRAKCYMLAKQAVDMSSQPARIWLGALYADNDVPVKLVAPKDVIQGKPVLGHHALAQWTTAANKGSDRARKMIREYFDEIDDQPIIWRMFQRDYPTLVGDALRYGARK